MPGVTERLGLPRPWKADTLTMCRVIAQASGLPIVTVWKGHPLGRNGRKDLRRHYIAACNALDLGVDLETASDIGARRVLAMVFDRPELLHRLDRLRDEEHR